MTDLYLLDKSALARVTLQPTVQTALERLDDLGVLATTAVIDLEVGSSARNLAEFDSTAADRADLYQELPLIRAVTDRARKVQRELVRRGQHRGPGVPDLLIAATGEVYGAVVVHYDRDFDTIRRHHGPASRMDSAARLRAMRGRLTGGRKGTRSRPSRWRQASDRPAA